MGADREEGALERVANSSGESLNQSTRSQPTKIERPTAPAVTDARPRCRSWAGVKRRIATTTTATATINQKP